MTSSAPKPQSEGEAGVASANGETQPSLGDPAGRAVPGVPLPSVPDHELLRCIGRGAYGAVWLARNVMGTLRAVKIVHREDFGRDRPFIREYEGLLNFEPISRSHPNLMQILHVGRRENYFYYVTELADDAGVQSAECRVPNVGTGAGAGNLSGTSVLGSDLSSYVPRTLQEDLERRGRLPVRECVSLATALAAALKHLHEHELVHRDVKPSNVIFVHGVPKLADIGLVATVGDSRSIVGTEGYLPPEGPGSPQADLYALGKLLYEVSTGRDRGDYPRLPSNLSAVPDAAELLEFNEVLLKACAKDTKRRYQEADELLADLALLERGDSVKRLRRLERHHALFKRVGVGLLALGILVSTAWWESWRAQRVANRHLAQLHVDKGTQRMVEGDYAGALPWLVGALQLDVGDATREWVHRTRIANVLERCPLPVAYFSTPDSKILAADLNPGGTVLATAHENGRVRLWDTNSRKLIRDDLPHNFPAVLCQFLPAGDRLLTASMEQKAYLWELARREVAPQTFTQAIDAGGKLYSVGLNETRGWVYLSKGLNCFAKAHKLTVAPEHLTLSLRLVGKGDVVLVKYEVRRAAPDGVILYQGEFNDTSAEEPFYEGRDSPAEPVWGRVWLMLENSSVGDSSADRGRIRWDNVRTRQYPSGRMPPPWQVLDDFSSGSLTNWVYFALPGEGRSWRVENGQLALSCAKLPSTQIPSGLVMYRQPLEISRTHVLEVEVDLVSVQAPHPMASLSLCSFELSTYTAPDRPFLAHGRWLASTGWEGPIRLSDLAHPSSNDATDERQREAPLELRPEGRFRDIDFSPNTNWVAVMDRTNRLSTWEFRTGREITPATAKREGVTGVRFSPDSRFLAVSHGEGLELLRTTDWQPVQKLVTGFSCAQPRFSPRTRRLAAVRDAREVVIWDLDTPTEPLAAFPHPADIRRIVFSPDGRYLVSSSANGTVRVWDTARGEPFGPPLPGALARFSPDGTRLLVFGVEGGIWLWDLTRVVDDTLPVPALRGEQFAAISSDRAMTAKLEGQGIALRTPADQYSLVLPGQVPLRRVAFSPDDRFLMAESLDLRAWVWDVRSRILLGPPKPIGYDATLKVHSVPPLAPDTRDKKALSDLAAILGQQRPDGRGGMIPVTEATRARLFDEIQRNNSARLNADDPSLIGWRQEKAEAAELAMDWDVAVFHWQHIVQRKAEARSALRSSAPEGGKRIRGISPQSRLAYARLAADCVRQAILSDCSGWSGLPRPPWAAREMLDLARFYTTLLGDPRGARSPAASFRGLGSGVLVLGGTGFDVRGIIDLKLTNQVTIPVGRACKRLHFLNAASQPTLNRETVGSYHITYADGQKAAVALLNPEDVPTYASDRFHEVSALDRTNASLGLRATLVWSGPAPLHGTRREPIYLTRTTWELPPSHQGQVVEYIELKAGPPELSAPLIFAITVE